MESTNIENIERKLNALAVEVKALQASVKTFSISGGAPKFGDDYWCINTMGKTNVRGRKVEVLRRDLATGNYARTAAEMQEKDTQNLFMRRYALAGDLPPDSTEAHFVVLVNARVTVVDSTACLGIRGFSSRDLAQVYIESEGGADAVAVRLRKGVL